MKLNLFKALPKAIRATTGNMLFKTIDILIFGV